MQCATVNPGEQTNEEKTPVELHHDLISSLNMVKTVGANISDKLMSPTYSGVRKENFYKRFF